MPSNKKLLQAAAGNAGESLYVEDVFSTYLYDGNGTSQTITNGIDLDGEGGLVWLKNRDGATNHRLYTTDLYSASNSNLLQTNLTTGGANTGSFELESFNSDGFTLGYSGGAYSESNGANTDYASWTFRKAEKFFDVVTYTGDGSGDRVISHSLNSTPASIIMKKTSATSDWPVYHTGAGTGAFEALALNQTSAIGGILNMVVGTSSSSFTVRSSFNDSGTTYVAYLFASDAGGFGDDGSESIIKCGSYTGTGSTSNPAVINCGFEPQWVLIKNAGSSENWVLLDSMRGIVAHNAGDDSFLKPNSSDAEETNSYINLTATGFEARTTSNVVNENGKTHIYIAIRRPMKTPESGTEVFAASTRTGTTAPSFPASFDVVDAAFRIYRPGGGDYARKFGSRLTGTRTLYTSSTAAEAPDSEMNWDYMDGWNSDTGVNTDVFSWMFKRATGFFDVVAYTGTGATPTVLSHNLGVVPEMMILKSRTSNENWMIYHSALGNTSALIFNTTAVLTGLNTWNSTSPSETTFTLGGGGNNGSQNGQNYIAYLFATLDGVSKVGSYTGTGSNVDVDCGFSAGARFILIKRTDSTGDWYVWDSERGIVAGNDPYLLLNSTAAEVTSTDYIDPLSSGFTVTSSAPAALNASGGTYIFLAIS